MSKYEEHTPGPWTVAGDSLSIMGNVVSVEIVDGDGFTIVDLPATPLLSGWREKHPHLRHWGEDVSLTQRERSEAELRANTALVLAAPTLAADNAALREVVGELVGALKKARRIVEDTKPDVLRDPHYQARQAELAETENVVDAAFTRAQPFLEGDKS